MENLKNLGQTNSPGLKAVSITYKIERIYYPVKKHRANGAVDRCIQTIKPRLGFLYITKPEISNNDDFGLDAKNGTIDNQNDTNFLHFGSETNTQLANVHARIVSVVKHLKRSLLEARLLLQVTK